MPDLTFFAAPFNNCLKCLVTLGMVTDERKCFKMFLKHIKQDVIIKDSITNSLTNVADPSLTDRNNFQRIYLADNF